MFGIVYGSERGTSAFFNDNEEMEDVNDDEEMEEVNDTSPRDILANSIPLFWMCLEGGQELFMYGKDKLCGRASKIDLCSASTKFVLGTVVLATEAIFVGIIISQER